jgi:SAM-dependent methyltransferase
MDLDQLIRDHGGIQLDIACGANKQPGFVGLDIQALPGVDVVHDLLQFPWPLPDACAFLAIASHFVEHVPKVMIYQGQDGLMHTWFPLITLMNEVWRVLKEGGKFMIAVPHGHSLGFLQDPTHAAPLSEATWVYFDPDHPFYNFYRPKPWKVEFVNWDPSGNMEVVMIKRAEAANE